MLARPRSKTRLESIGVYLPERVQSTAELMSQLACGPIFDLEAITGIASRRVHAPDEDSYALALKAARNCLNKSKYDARDLEALIYVSITRFKGGLRTQFDPAISLFLRRELGASNAQHFDITNACAGMCTGMHLVDTMIRSGTVRNGLVVSGECITPLADVALQEVSGIDDQQLASLTVGDAGSACVLEGCSANDPGVDFARFVTLGTYSDLCLAMPSDKRPGVVMYTRSAALHIEAIKRFPRFLAKVLAEHGMRLSDYDYLIPHQTASGALRAGTQALANFFGDVPEVISIVGEYGNTSSTSHLLALDAAIADKRIKQGDRVLFLVMASGLVLGLVSFTVGFLEATHAHENRYSQRLQPGWSGQID
ncbi:MAG TPA: 3-oxoacyl-[acyl-carrier-protein] synthase III C-terminal domain-containing protein [Polyangiaceae bacterium]|nr:3-oxoacyl-[acyl-carrier-protein] synthase III C-terminal domain-containing protein [Polyangiaceae bacterium]